MFAEQFLVLNLHTRNCNKRLADIAQLARAADL